MGNEAATPRVFSLTDAHRMLPSIQKMTAAAVSRTEALADAIDEVGESDPRRVTLGAELKAVVDEWSDRIREMGLEAKGLWLVDWDNGEGYYCWQHPEATVSHFHGYEDGFAGRMKIV